MEYDKELVDAISDRVVEKLEPLLDGIYNESRVGVVVGRDANGRWLGRSRKGNSSSKPYSYISVSRWYQHKGLPLFKTPQGEWAASKANLDSWFFERGQITRMANKLRIGRPHVNCKSGIRYNLSPEQLTLEEMDEIDRERQRLRVKKAIRMEA